MIFSGVVKQKGYVSPKLFKIAVLPGMLIVQGLKVLKVVCTVTSQPQNLHMYSQKLVISVCACF